MRPGQQRHHDRERRPRPLGRGGKRLGQAALAAFQIGHLEVSALARLPGGLGDLAADPVTGGAGAAGYGDQQGRRVRRQAEPVRAAVPAGTASAAGTAGQHRTVAGWIAALRQWLSALREWVAALREWFAAVRERVSAAWQWFAALREWFSALRERVSAAWQWFAALREWFSAL